MSEQEYSSDSSTSEVTETSESGNSFINFNQPNFRNASKSLVVSFKSGFKVLNLTPDLDLEIIYEDKNRNVIIIEQFLNSSLVAVVYTSSPKKLSFININSCRDIGGCNYSSDIVGVKMNAIRIVIVLINQIHIVHKNTMQLLHLIKDAPDNPKGLFAVTSTDSMNKLNYLAYPGSNTNGAVCIVDISTNDFEKKVNFVAHDSALAALAFSEDGFLLATASIKGTVIRVFNVHDTRKIMEFRRGLARCVSISSLSFSSDSKFVCCSSNTETVHVFKMNDLKPESSNKPNNEIGWIGYCASVVSSPYNYLYAKVAGTCENRSFADVHLPFSGINSVCAIVPIGGELRFLIASANGYLFIYSFNPSEKQDCQLLKTYQFDGDEVVAV